MAEKCGIFDFFLSFLKIALYNRLVLKLRFSNRFNENVRQFCCA